MFEKTAIQIATTKLTGASLLPASFFFMSGIIIWHLWRKQEKLQAETSKLSKEFEAFKKQITNCQKTDGKSNTSFSSADKNTAPTKDTINPEKLGLFEYLIEDNIRLRKHA